MSASEEEQPSTADANTLDRDDTPDQTASEPQVPESEETEETNTAEPVDSKAVLFSPTEFIRTVYENRYYRQIAKSVLVFFVALKMARESNKMVIPMNEYAPFGKSC